MKKFLSSQKGLAKISILFFVIDFIWKLSMMSMLNYKPKLTDTCYICNLFTIFFGSVFALYNDKIWGRRLNIWGYTFLLFLTIVDFDIGILKEFFDNFFYTIILLLWYPISFLILGIVIVESLVLPVFMIRLWLKATDS